MIAIAIASLLASAPALACSTDAAGCAPAVADAAAAAPATTPSLSSVGLPEGSRGYLDLKPGAGGYGLGNIEMQRPDVDSSEELQELRLMIQNVDDQRARMLRGTEVVGER